MHSQSASRIDAIAQALAALRRDMPALAPILNAHEPLLRAEEQVLELLVTSGQLPRLPVDPDRLRQGLPALADVRLDFLLPALQLSAEVMLPALALAFPQAGKALGSLDAVEWKTWPLAQAAYALLQGDAAGLDVLAGHCGQPPEGFALALRALLRPVLRGLAMQTRPAIPQVVWERGTCPLCGQGPALAYLSRSDEQDNEFLRGGGGQKLLQCEMCGLTWRVDRSSCPACGNSDGESREYFGAKEFPGLRVDACSACGCYCPTIDLREFAQDPHPRLAPLGCLPLDILAQERGYRPMAPTIWNSFGLANDREAAHEPA